MMPPPDQPSSSEDAPNLKASIISGTAWSMASVLGAKIISLFAQIILARLLLPSDFGMAAIAIGITSLLFVANPIIASDVAIQRSDRITKVLARCQRLGMVAAILVFLAILVAAYFVPNRSGHRLELDTGGPLQETSSLESINDGAAIPILQSQGVVFTIEGAEGKQNLVRIDADPDLSPTVEMALSYLNAGIAATDSTGVRLDIVEEQIVAVPGEGNAEPVLQSKNTSTAMLFETLGLPFYSGMMFLLMLAMSIRPIVAALRAKPMVILRMELRFRAISIYSFLSAFLGSALAITLAFLGAGPIAVIAALVSMPVFDLIFITIGSLPYRQKYRSESDPEEPLVGDFFTLAGAQWIHSLAFSIGYVVLGFFMSDAMVGIYFFGFTLSLQINALIGSSLASPLLPIFASIKNNPRRFDGAFLRVSGMLAVISIPICFFLAILSPWIIPLVFGAKWIVVVPLMGFLFVAQGIAITNTAAISGLKATGRFRTWAGWQAILTASIVGAGIIAGIYQSILLMSALVLVVYAVCSPLCVGLALQSGNALRAWRVHLIPVVCASPILLGMLIYRYSDSYSTNVGLSVVWGCVCLLGYIVLIRSLAPEQYGEIARLFQQASHRLRGSRSADSG